MDDYIKSTIEEQEIFVPSDIVDIVAAPFIFEVSYSQNFDKATKTFGPDPVISCPICNKVSFHTMAGTQVYGYTKGEGFLDKAGVRREMNLHTLKTNDPYAYLRPEGDKEEMIKKIEKNGRREMKYKNFSLIKEIDETNAQAVQRAKKERLANKTT